jgi:RNA recognition motif-containing protein
VVFKNPPIECSVFVTNVPNSVEEDHLFTLFGKCGLVYGVHKFTPESLKRKIGL